MKCPRCKGENVKFQFQDIKQSRGCFGALGWILFALCTMGIGILLIPLLSGKNSVQKTFAVCQDCGKTWEVKG